MKKYLLFLLLIVAMLALPTISVLAQTDTTAVVPPVEETPMLVTILVALLAISEVLALIPAIKSNSIFQLIFNILLRLVNPPGKK